MILRTAILWTILQSLLAVGPALADDAAGNKDRLDGLEIEAFESYALPRRFEIAIGTSLYPLNAYYTGFGINGGVTFYFSNTFGWEILNASYAFTVDKALSSQLAEDFGVAPASIERLNYLASSSLVFVPTFGKTVLFGKYIQYFRTGLTLGATYVKTSQVSGPGVAFGARFDTYIGESFSWRLEVRDHFIPSGSKHFLSLGFGTAIHL